MGLFSDNNDKKKGQDDYGLFSFLEELNKKDNENDEVYDNLEDWQKEEVDKGLEDSFNFEEEDLEDDDYYDDDE